jgi:hypothetical protein
MNRFSSPGIIASYNGVNGTFIPDDFGNEVNPPSPPKSIEISSTSSTQSSLISRNEDSFSKAYPPDEFTTDDDDLLSSFLSSPHFKHLLLDKVDNIVFVFEESQTLCTKTLTSMGPLSNERWSTTKPTIHCVMQNCTDNGMYYLARSANMCHYQVHIRSLLKSLIAYEGERLDIKLYNPCNDYSNEFMVVGNTIDATNQLQENIDWGSIDMLINENSSSSSSSSTSTSSSSSSSSSSGILLGKRKRQVHKIFVDFGWTWSTCQSRVGSTSGVALPRLKPLTENEVVKKLFTGASTILEEITVPWINSDEHIFIDSSEPKRAVNIQERIAPRNVIEGIRVATSDSSQLCGCHIDSQNSTKPTMSAVFCASKIRSDKRSSLICFGRKSVDVALEEMSRVNPFTKAMVDFYSSVNSKQRVVTIDLLDGKQTSPISNFPVISNHCNMNPFSYQLTFVEFTMRLTHKFNLNLLEVISIVTCYEIFPHCLYYFGVAANIFLQDIHTEDTQRFRGVSFGYEMYKVMMHSFHATRIERSKNQRKRSSSTDTNLPPPRFQCYTSLEILTTLQSFPLWEERCNHKLHTIMMFNDKHWSTKNQPTMRSSYKKLMKVLNPLAPNCGKLCLQHEFAIMSSLGLLPMWVFSYADIDFKAKPMEHFQTEFPCIDVADEKKRTSTMTTLTTVLNEVSTFSLSLRDTENIICKAFRAGVRNKSNNSSSIPKKQTCHFRDILFPNQCVIDFRNDSFLVYDFDGKSTSFTGSLIQKWHCCGDLLEMNEVVQRYKTMIDVSNQNSFSYETGKRVSPKFLMIGKESIDFMFKLPIIKYGNDMTNKAATAIANKVIFN